MMRLLVVIASAFSQGPGDRTKTHTSKEIEQVSVVLPTAVPEGITLTRYQIKGKPGYRATYFVGRTRIRDIVLIKESYELLTQRLTSIATQTRRSPATACPKAVAIVKGIAPNAKNGKFQRQKLVASVCYDLRQKAHESTAAMSKWYRDTRDVLEL